MGIPSLKDLSELGSLERGVGQVPGEKKMMLQGLSTPRVSGAPVPSSLLGSATSSVLGPPPLWNLQNLAFCLSLLSPPWQYLIGS